MNRFSYESGYVYQDGLDIIDEDGDPTGEKGETCIEGFVVHDAIVGHAEGKEIAFCRNRHDAERIVAALNSGPA